MTDVSRPSLLVTVGSTLFPSLTDTILSTRTLSVLADRISILRVQLGNATIPQHLTETISHYETDEDGFKGEFKGMRIEIMRFTADFDELVNSSDLVVSHAGSGSILTTLRAGKPLLIVPNTDLMDNHQAQLAAELERGEYLMVSDIPGLLGTLETFIDGRGKGMKPFPAREPSRFRGIMDEMMGFQEDRL